MNPLIKTITKLGPARLGIIFAVGVATVVFFVYLTSRVAKPEMTLLYGELSVQDSGQIVSELESRQIPYRLGSDGQSIYVPHPQVSRVRVLMAEQGLPSGGSIGYEIFDEQDSLGTTSFVQNINQTRAMEGELSRTISSIGNIKSARVHLVLPQRELFSRERQEPSASIVLVTQGRYSIPKQQILAIQHLVAAAVPNLKPTLVSIIDDKGNLLARGVEGDDEIALANSTEERRLAYQTRLQQSVEELLERYLGRGNARVQINVDMDFDRVTENSETFDPDGQVVRSTQTVEEESAEQDSDGQQTVSVQNNLPDADINQLGEGATNQSNTQRTEETVNYEISKTIKTAVKESGTVRRLSVAVLINDKVAISEDGERVYSTRTPEEIERLEAIVQSAVGFNSERGDSLEIANLRFAEVDPLLLPDEDILGLDRNEIMRFAELLILAFVAVLILLLVVRPLVTRIFEQDFDKEDESMPNINELLYGPDGQQMALVGPQDNQLIPSMPALSDGSGNVSVLTTPQAEPSTSLSTSSASALDSELEQMLDMNKVEGRIRASSVRRVGELVDSNPAEAVNLIRSWLAQDFATV